MSENRLNGASLFVFFGLCFWLLAYAAPAAAQVAQRPEKVEPGQHQHTHHHLHTPMGEEKCELIYTYDDDPSAPVIGREFAAQGKCRHQLTFSTQ